MRPIIAGGLLVLGLSATAHEPEYSALLTETAGANPPSPLVEIESAIGRGDRLAVASLAPRALAVEIFKPSSEQARLQLASASSEIDAELASANIEPSDDRSNGVSLDDLCNALFTSAQDNDLPVPFFANLIWQESRLNPDDVSKKGAQGIAQFMPQTAAEKGLHNPFDPMQAIPTSARFLRELRLEFGNLGFVAAAYNAGPRRVVDWLQRRSNLPRETRDYVVRVTGLSVDVWRSMAVSNDSLTFVPRLPCRNVPAFANVEQQQLQQAQAQQANIEQAAADDPPPAGADDALMLDQNDNKSGNVSAHKRAGRAERSHTGTEAHRAGHERHPVKREAERPAHTAKTKHKTA
jgi:hypothetical protein